MRRLIRMWPLGIALAIGSVVVAAEDRGTGVDHGRPPDVRNAARPSATVEKRPSWTRRLMPALQRLRLNPGHDHAERSAASSLRP